MKLFVRQSHGAKWRGQQRAFEAQEIREGTAAAPGGALQASGVGQVQGIANNYSIRRPRRRWQGRHDSRDYGTRKPQNLSSHGVASTLGPRKNPAVYSALHTALPGGRRDRDF